MASRIQYLGSGLRLLMEQYQLDEMVLQTALLL
jgi:hypothetical protein